MNIQTQITINGDIPSDLHLNFIQPSGTYQKTFSITQASGIYSYTPTPSFQKGKQGSVIIQVVSTSQNLWYTLESSWTCTAGSQCICTEAAVPSSDPSQGFTNPSVTSQSSLNGLSINLTIPSSPVQSKKAPKNAPTKKLLKKETVQFVVINNNTAPLTYTMKNENSELFSQKTTPQQSLEAQGEHIFQFVPTPMLGLSRSHFEQTTDMDYVVNVNIKGTDTCGKPVTYTCQTAWLWVGKAGGFNFNPSKSKFPKNVKAIQLRHNLVALVIN